MKISNMNITWDDFQKVEIRTGTFRGLNYFSEARKPAYQLVIDFGAVIGTKRFSGQVTIHYQNEELLNK